MKSAMPLVVTLIAPAPGALTDTRIGDAEKALTALGAEVTATDWLASGEAADIFFENLDPDQADAAVRRALANSRIDCIAQDTLGRRKRLLVSDMESTIIEQEMLDEIAELKGIKAEIANITARAMNGEIDFVGALVERVSLLAGLPEEAIDRLATRNQPGATEAPARRAHGPGVGRLHDFRRQSRGPAWLRHGERQRAGILGTARGKNPVGSGGAADPRPQRQAGAVAAAGGALSYSAGGNAGDRGRSQ
jgi:hypothetical protein